MAKPKAKSPTWTPFNTGGKFLPSKAPKIGTTRGAEHLRRLKELGKKKK